MGAIGNATPNTLKIHKSKKTNKYGLASIIQLCDLAIIS